MEQIEATYIDCLPRQDLALHDVSTYWQRLKLPTEQLNLLFSIVLRKW